MVNTKISFLSNVTFSVVPKQSPTIDLIKVLLQIFLHLLIDITQLMLLLTLNMSLTLFCYCFFLLNNCPESAITIHTKF